MRIFLFLVLLALPLVSSAELTSTAPAPAKNTWAARAHDYFGLMSLGLDLRMERDQEQGTQVRSSPSISLGLGYKHYLGLIEYSQSQDNTGGNATLDVSHSSETAMLWGQLHTEDEWKFRPFFGFGLGAYRESATSEFYQQSQTDQGAWRDIYGAAFGFRWAGYSPFWLSIEGRVLINQNFDPNPTVAGLVRIGFVLE